MCLADEYSDNRRDLTCSFPTYKSCSDDNVIAHKNTGDEAKKDDKKKKKKNGQQQKLTIDVW